MKNQQFVTPLRQLRQEVGQLTEREQCMLNDICDILGLDEAAVAEILGADNAVTTTGGLTLVTNPRFPIAIDALPSEQQWGGVGV